MSLVTTYLVSLSPTPNHIPLLASSPWQTLGFLLICPFLLMEPVVGRCCYPWQGNIFGNQGLEWKGQYFFCNQEASLIYFFTESFMEYRIVMAKIPREEWWGRKPFNGLGKLSPFGYCQPHLSTSETSLVTHLSPCWGKKQLFRCRAVMQTGSVGCSQHRLKHWEGGWAGSCQILQKTTFPESLQIQAHVSFHHYSESLSWSCQNSAFLWNSTTRGNQTLL